MHTTSKEFVKEFKKIKDSLVVKYGTRGSNKEVESFTDLLANESRLQTRLLPTSGETTFSLIDDKNTLIAMHLEEMYPCCGKVLAKHLYAKTEINHITKGTVSYKDIFEKIFPLFLEMIEAALKNCKYSSYSFIVSAPEQANFYEHITKLPQYKIVNQFENIRMPNKNLCVEFCRNLSD